MDSTRLANLYEAIKDFCELLVNVQAFDETNVRDLLDAFSEIHKAAWYLPAEYADWDVKKAIGKLIDKLESEMSADSLVYRFYYSKATDFSKLNDIDDVKDLTAGPYTAIRDMGDITGGMILYEHGFKEYAFLYWSERFHVHWFWHVRDAITELYRMCQILESRKNS